MSKAKVLFLCTGNSVRSQMGEALLRRHGGEYFEVYSAGLEPSRVNSLTLAVLQEKGIDTSALYSKGLLTFVGKVSFDYLITVCAEADQNCPIFPGVSVRLHWPFEDPAKFEGNADEKLAKFREVRGQMEARILTWLAELTLKNNAPTPA